MAKSKTRRQERTSGQPKTEKAKKADKAPRNGVVMLVSFPVDQASRLIKQIRTGDSKSGFLRRAAMEKVEQLEALPG